MDPIRQITSPDYFTSLCKALLAEEYEDFETVDDSGGDGGNDGHSASKEVLFQIYCPEKPAKINDARYQLKIRDDLKKAKNLNDSGRYKIKKWVFITPDDLREPTLAYLREEAKKNGFVGISWSSVRLIGLFAKHSHLRSQFPDLIQPDIEAKLDDLKGTLVDTEEIKREYKTKLEKRYQKKIDDIKKIGDEGKNETAKKEYLQILSELLEESEEIDSHLLFRVYNNLGVCEMNLGNEKEAIILFKKGYEIEPSAPQAIINYALAKHFENNSEEALDIINEFLKGDSENTHAISIKANIFYHLKREEELSLFLKEKKDLEHLYLYEGIQQIDAKNFDKAVEFFDKVVMLNPDNAEALMYVAENILNGNTVKLSGSPFPPDKLPVDIQHSFQKAAEALRKAIEIIEKREERTKLEIAYTNLSACYSTLGLHLEAIETADKASAIDAKSAMPYINKGLSLLRLGRFEEAIESFEMYNTLGGGYIDADRHIAYCSLKSKDLKKAEPIISSLLEKDGILDLDIAGLAVELYSRKIDFGNLQDLLSRLEQEFPENSQALRIRATYLQKQGLENAEALFQKAVDCAPTDLDKLLAEIDLANYKFDHNEFSSAEVLYEKYINFEEANLPTRRYARCLYNSGQYGTLLKWVEKLKNEAREDSIIRQLEANSNLFLSNLERASEIFKALFEDDPTEAEYLVQYGCCQFRLGRESLAIEAFKHIKGNIKDNDTRNLIILAEGYEIIGDRDTALELTYRALEATDGDSHAHLSYIFTFLRREQAGGEDPEEKYIKKFQKTIGEFTQRFPNEKALQSFQIEGNDVSEMLKMVGVTADLASKATKLYQDSAAPIAVIPKMVGKDPFNIWASFIQTPEVGIKMAFGTQEELESEAIAVKEGIQNGIVIDIYPLFLMAHLNKLEILPKTFKEVYVHQNVLDALIEIVEEKKLSVKKGISYIGEVEGRPQMTEVPAEQVEKTLKFLEGIKSFITAEGTVKIVGLSKDYNYGEKNIINALHESTRDSLLLAKEKGLPFYSDDRLLRAIGVREEHLKAFSSYALLAELQSIASLTLEEVFDALKVMLELNYEYIPLNGNLLHYHLKKEGYNFEKIELVVDAVVKKETSIQSLGAVLSDFLLLSFLDPLFSDEVILGVLTKIFDKVSKNHNLEEVKENLVNSLAGRVPSEALGRVVRLLRSVI